jgi:hypothetical protein
LVLGVWVEIHWGVLGLAQHEQLHMIFRLLLVDCIMVFAVKLF